MAYITVKVVEDGMREFSVVADTYKPLVMDEEDYFDLMDGEGELVEMEDGRLTHCFNHNIFINDICRECKQVYKRRNI